jgi:uncharacterized protein
MTPESERRGAPARPRARPVSGRRPPGERLFARLAARTSPRGMREIAAAPRSPLPAGSDSERLLRGGLARARKHALLVTFRRDGAAVPTPVWAAPAGERLYVRTARASGKVARLRHDARALVAPCSARGVPLGAPFEAHARVLAAGEEPRAEHALRDAYGVGRALFEWWMDVLRVDMCYLEIAPARWAAGDDRP